jgi:hypothetical protein
MVTTEGKAGNGGCVQGGPAMNVWDFFIIIVEQCNNIGAGNSGRAVRNAQNFGAQSFVADGMHRVRLIQVYPEEDILKAKIDLLGKTNMVDYGMDIHKALYKTEEVPEGTAVLNLLACLFQACCANRKEAPSVGRASASGCPRYKSSV